MLTFPKIFLGIAYLMKLSESSPINTSGFSNFKISSSSEGFATCISGNVPVSATTNTNAKILIDSPKDQYAATAIIVDYLKANSSEATQINGGATTVSGTFNIAAKFCYPKNWTGSTVQFLIHGIGFNQSYWDFAEGYSYIDVAAQAGYATFSYDRLGVGASDHPDPIQVVQAALQVEIAHSLISSLREGTFAGKKFNKIIGVGHSFGSIQSVGLLAKYPTDYDAVVLTGFSTSTTSQGLTFADFNSAIASQNQPARFGGLQNGYLVVDSPIGNQFAFFSYPNFDPKIFLADDATKQTFTFGEFFTLGSVVAPSTFTGPVFTVLGEFDYIFAQGNAYYPSDLSVLVQPALFPDASKGSKAYIVPGAGHAINLHFQAGLAFNQIQEFVKDNGF